MARLTKKQAAELLEIRTNLKRLLPEGKTVYSNTVSCSSGGTRHIQLFIAYADEYERGPMVADLTLRAGKLLGYRRNIDRGTIVTNGYGSGLVYHLGRCLYNNEYALKHIAL